MSSTPSTFTGRYIVLRLTEAAADAARRADDDLAPSYLRSAAGSEAATLRRILRWLPAEVAHAELEAISADQDWDARCETAMDGVPGSRLVLDTPRGDVEVAMG